MKKNRLWISVVLFTVLILSGLVWVYLAKINVPYVCFSGPGEGIWSIGIYDLTFDGRTLHMSGSADNPVLTAAHVTDRPARYLADPFLIREAGKFYLFFEVLDAERGVIGLARSDDGRRWRYDRIVLEEPFHLSYPCVWRWKDDYYMIPESVAAGCIRLYKAVHFPHEWQYVKTIIADRLLVDPTVLYHQGSLWLFAASPDNKNLYLFSSDRPEGPWREHPESPVVRDDDRDARPAGSILSVGDRLIRFSQDCSIVYGKAVRGHEIIKLTRDQYRERPLDGNPLLKDSGSGWNGIGMHQISASRIQRGRWIAAVDGKRRSDQYIFCVGNSVYRVP